MNVLSVNAQLRNKHPTRTEGMPASSQDFGLESELEVEIRPHPHKLDPHAGMDASQFRSFSVRSLQTSVLAPQYPYSASFQESMSVVLCLRDSTWRFAV